MELTVRGLLADYRAGRRDPSAVAASVLERMRESTAPVWITRVEPGALLAAAEALDGADRSLPLYGVPFAVKDNIDVAGMATTAGCPGYATVATETAPVVRRLLDAGALLVGKTNMDQFATGLVGTRSPYGAVSSVFDPERVGGGSSSGSAAALALGLVAFSLGTDTAGSGRVPAAFNGLVGVKPSRGLLSLRGVVPACASLDCMSLFARDVGDAALVLDVAAGFDPEDRWSRPAHAPATARHGRIGVPRPGLTEPDDRQGARAWEAALARAADRYEVAEVDVSPLLDAAPLLYAVWMAERTTDLGAVIAAGPDGLDPTVASTISAASGLAGTEVFAAVHRLAALRRQAESLWERVDAVLLPTTAAHPTHAEVAADPVGANANLGRFTNFVNLMDLAALAVPGPARADGLPFGVSLIAPAFHDHRLLALGARWCGEDSVIAQPGTVRLAAVGAHMSGLPLNGQLTDRGARLVAATSTTPEYRLYALPGAGLPRPGLVRVGDGGAPIALEVWELSPAGLGALMGDVPAPLAIGRVRLADGEEVAGFVCEAIAAEGAQDITPYGGWRAFLDAGRAEVMA